MAFDVEGAKKAGYSDAEIAAHLAQRSGFDIAGAKKSGYSDAEVVNYLAGLSPGAAAIPYQRQANTTPPPGPAMPAPQPEPGIVDKAIGTGEAALTTLTGATGGTLGLIGGTLKGLAEQILSGNFGTPEAARLVEQSASEGARSLTYEPRTASGQDQAAAVGGLMQQLLPVAGLTGEMAAIGNAGARGTPAGVLARAGTEGTARDIATAAGKAADIVAPGVVSPAAVGEAAAAGAGAAVNAAATAADRVAGLAKTATTLPRRALEAVRKPAESTPTPGTMGSVGAAGTDMATQRVAAATDLPYPLTLTKGQATRDPAQLKFEVETAKLPEQGAPLRQRTVEQNAAILNNFDAWIDQTGAQAPSLRAVGAAVDKALVEQAARDKTQVNVAYAKARASEEALAPVDVRRQIAIGEGPSAIVSTPLDWINSQPAGLPNTALLDAARQDAVRLGIADLKDGKLVLKRNGRYDSLTNTNTGTEQLPTVGKMEDWRRTISERTGFDPNDIRQSTILKALIDGQTAPVAGTLFKEARGLRARFAQNYEDRAVISKMLNNKRGTADRQVALEDVFDHAILKGSLDDVRNVRRVLHRSGEEGAQAWRELQGAAATWLRDEATKNVATDSAGRRVISPAALDKAIRSLDVDGRLDFVFGKKGAQQMRDLRDLAQYVKTVPPEAGINTSNTAATLLSAFADVAFSGMTGTPAPVTTVTRMAVKSIKDRSLRKRIEDALNNPAKQAPARTDNPPRQAPARTVH